MRSPGGRDADLAQQLQRSRPRRAGADVEMGQDGLDDLLAHGVKRVEAGQGVLEDRSDTASPDAADRLVGEAVDTFSGEADRAGGDTPRRLQEADDRVAGERLAGARFAHHAEHLAARDGKRDAVDRNQRAPPRVGNSTRRFSTSSSGSLTARPPCGVSG